MNRYDALDLIIDYLENTSSFFPVVDIILDDYVDLGDGEDIPCCKIIFSNMNPELIRELETTLDEYLIPRDGEDIAWELIKGSTGDFYSRDLCIFNASDYYTD